MKNNIIRKSNDIITACYDLTTPELRLVYSCISKINFEQVIDQKDTFVVELSEYAETFNLDRGNAHRELEKAVDVLWVRDITILRENNTPLKTRWISSQAKYHTGGAEIRFAPDVIPYLTTLHKHGNFTMYKIKQISKLKNRYAIRLYEILKQYEKLNHRIIDIEELRKILGLASKYPRMRDFKEFVIDKAIAEINKYTDLFVSYEQKKRGKKIISFNFLITTKTSNAKKSVKGKKHLTAAEVDKKGRIGEDYPDLYARLKAEGYSFDVKRKY